MKKIVALAISLGAIGLSTAPAVAADANGNHETYVWVVAGDTAVAPDGSTIFVKGRGTLVAGPGSAATGAALSRSMGARAVRGRQPASKAS